MSALTIFVLTIFAVIAVAIGAIYLLYFLFSNFSPNRGKVKKDLDKLQKQLPPPEDLVPWSNEEMQLLSLDQTNDKLKKGLTTTGSGSLLSIYHEPMVNYAYKKYIASGEDAALLVETSDRKFEYRIRTKGIDVRINGKEIGTLRPNGVLYNKRKRVIARINERTEQALNPILVFDQHSRELKEVGNLVNTDKTKKLNPKAFQFVENKLEKHEEDLFLALALYNVIHQKVYG